MHTFDTCFTVSSFCLCILLLDRAGHSQNDEETSRTFVQLAVRLVAGLGAALHIQRTHVLGVRGVVLLESSEGRFLWILPSMGHMY